jgi:tetratricopeptide (TPR) repeat protein
MLNAAEVLMHPLGEWDEAVDLCDDALEYAETKEEIADCLLLRVDALLGKGDVEEAKKCMARLPDPPFENGSYVFLIGRAYYELGETEKAAPFIEEAVRADPSHADAYYYLGLLRDDAGDARGAVEAFLRSRALDMTKPAPAWSPSPEAFAQLVRRVIQGLDAILARWVRDADVYIVDVPGAELVVDGVDPRAMVILDARTPDEAAGTPIGEPVTMQARLFIYPRNVERGAGSALALEAELSAGLEREITAVFLDRESPMPSEKHQLN